MSENKGYVDPFDSANAQQRELKMALLNQQNPTERKLQGPVALMSRRDHFAAAALQGLIPDSKGERIDNLIEDAVHFADKLIAKLDEVKHD